MGLVARYVQSSGSMDLSEQGIEITLTFYTSPGTAGGLGKQNLDSRSIAAKLKWFRSRHDVVDIPEKLLDTDDYMCLPYSLLLGKVFISEGMPAVTKLRRAPLRLRRQALELCREADLPSNLPMGLQELTQYAQLEMFRKHHILAFTDRGLKFFDSGDVGRDGGNIFLVLSNEHFFMVSSSPLQ